MYENRGNPDFLFDFAKAILEGWRQYLDEVKTEVSRV
jgi:hypothetical protein